MNGALLRYAWLTGTLLAAAAFVSLRMSMSSVYIGADLSALMMGDAHIPYQYRVLVPIAVRGVTALGLGAPLAWLLAPLGIAGLSDSFAVPPDVIATYLAVEILSVWGILVSFRALAALFVPRFAVQAGAALVLLAALGVLPLCSPGSRLWYPSDMPAVLVVVVSYLLLFSGRVGLFCALFPAATLNRETTLFLLPLLFLLPQAVLRAPHAKACGVALALCWMLEKAALYLAFRGNHGFPLHPNVVVNLESVREISLLATVALIALGSALLYWASAVRRHDARLLAAWRAALIFVAALFLAGKMDEMRIYLELLPLAALALLVAVAPTGPSTAAAESSVAS